MWGRIITRKLENLKEQMSTVIKVSKKKRKYARIKTEGGNRVTMNSRSGKERWSQIGMKKSESAVKSENN
jgi:hypothetical protein